MQAILSAVRVIFAAVFVFGSVLGSVGVLGAYLGDGPWPWWANLVPMAAMLGAMLIALFVFNRSGFRPGLSRKTLAEQIAELDEKGLLVRQPFQAVRAFEVEELEDEGLHYFLELRDGRVLFLSGQYLYDFEPVDDDPEFNGPRRFPCAEFEILRHREAGYVVDIRCGGSILEPEVLAPAFTREVWRRGELPEDGQIIEGKSYDALKRERMTK